MDMFFWWVIWFIILIFSVIIHECAHAWSAYRLGDPTAYHQGRITLNPIPHIDPFMTIILPLLLLFTVGFMFGGAKPVPINPYNFRDPEKGMMISSLAGPLSNFILALIGFSCFILIATTNILSGAFLTFNYFLMTLFITLNLILAVFNLIPIPPFDGSRILRYFLPWDMKESFDRIGSFGMIIVMLLLMTVGFRFIRILLDVWFNFLYALSNNDAGFYNLLLRFFYKG